MTLDALLSRLDAVRQRGARWSAACPAHADKSPSLSISEGEKGLLLRCFAGCTVAEICEALGLAQHELFYDSALPRGQRSAPKPPRLDRTALAFRFELAALDLRLRADRIIEAGKSLNIAALDDIELGHAIGHVAQAYADRERAELFEGVADDLRLKAHNEKENRETKTSRVA